MVMPPFKLSEEALAKLPPEQQEKMKAVIADYQELLKSLEKAAEKGDKVAVADLQAKVKAFKEKYPLGGN